MEFKSNDYEREANRYWKINIGGSNCSDWASAVSEFCLKYWNVIVDYTAEWVKLNGEWIYIYKFKIRKGNKVITNTYYDSLAGLSGKQRYLIVINSIRKLFKLGGYVE